jgi:hypothetical protein
MPQPKASTVVLLLLLLACVALYVLGVGLGAKEGSSGGGTPVSKQERERWRERFFKPPPVAPNDLRASGCVLSSGTVQVLRGVPCQVEVAKSGSRLRTLGVEPQSASRVDVKLTPHGGPSLPATVANLGEHRDLDIPGEGASVSLTCLQTVGSACPVKLR